MVLKGHRYAIPVLKPGRRGNSTIFISDTSATSRPAGRVLHGGPGRNKVCGENDVGANAFAMPICKGSVNSAAGMVEELGNQQ